VGRPRRLPSDGVGGTNCTELPMLLGGKIADWSKNAIVIARCFISMTCGDIHPLGPCLTIASTGKIGKKLSFGTILSRSLYSDSKL
jgi:hypothetical protein